MFPQPGGYRTPSSAGSSADATRSRSSTRARARGGRRSYGPDDYAAFNEAFEVSPLGSVVIHAVYLINTATPDAEIREKSLASLLHAVRIGDAIGAAGVVLHAGSRKKDPVDEAVARSGEVVREVLAETERLPDPVREHRRHPGTARPRLRRAGDAGRCRRRRRADRDLHRLLSPVRLRLRDPRAGGAGGVVDDLDRLVGLERLRCLHVNDSAVPMGANRDKHANVGEGEMGGGRDRDVPLRAPLRGPAGSAGDPGAREEGP